jgi:hypothetical protein
MLEKALNSIPFLFRKSKSEEKILLNSTKDINMKTFDKQSSSDSVSISDELNDFQDVHCRSNRIDEWQAGWNVTNAIQVKFYLL